MGSVFGDEAGEDSGGLVDEVMEAERHGHCKDESTLRGAESW